MNPATEDQRERSQRDKEPQKDSLKERTNADFPKSFHGEPRSNQVERDGQADNTEMFQHRIRRLEDVSIGICDRCDAEEEYERWPLDTRIALICQCGSDRKRHDP